MLSSNGLSSVFFIAYSLLPEINWIKLPFTLCKINCISLCESKATRKIYILFPFWAALLSYGVIAQQAFTDKKKKAGVERQEFSRRKRQIRGERGNHTQQTCSWDLSNKREDNVLE